MRSSRTQSFAAAAPAALIVAVCCALPLAWMAVILLANPQVRAEFLPTAFRAQLLGRTLGYNGAAACIATAMGLPAAMVLGRGRGFVARLMWVVIPAALLLPSLSYAYGWSQLVRLSRPMLRPWGITFMPNGPLDKFRCIWSLGTWLWAVPAVLIGLALRRMDATVQQQALLDGALRRVTLRQLAGPIIASLAIVTILASQEFAVYEPTGISVVATEMRMVFDTGAYSSTINSISGAVTTGAGLHSPDQPARAAAAVATAVPLLLVTILLAVVAAWGASREGAGDLLAPGDWPPALDASPWATLLTVLLVLINIGVPIVALFASLKFGLQPARVWGEFAPQMGGAILVATEAAAVAMVLALFSAAQWVPGMLGVALASFLIGGQLLAIGQIRIYNRPGLSWVEDGSILAVVTYIGRFGWLAVAAGRSSWSAPWRELRDMASLDGAAPMAAARGVVWPLAWPMLLAGALLAGALSVTEVPATVLIYPQNPQVLTPTLMQWLHMNRSDPMIEASLLMMATVLLPAVAAVLLASLSMRMMRRQMTR